MSEWYQLSPFEWSALRLSLIVAGWAVVASLPFGIAWAWLLARKEFPGKFMVDGLVHLPLVVPPVVVGYLLLVLFGRNGVLGQGLESIFGLSFAFNWKGAVLASAVMSFPLMVRAIRLSIESVDTGIEEAARTLGAGPWRVFLTVTLPLALPGVISGVILAFARCLGEFGATITFVSNIPGETQTLPLALYTYTQVPDGEGGAFKLCLISIAVAAVALMASELGARWLQNRMKGART